MYRAYSSTTCPPQAAPNRARKIGLTRPKTDVANRRRHPDGRRRPGRDAKVDHRRAVAPADAAGHRRPSRRHRRKASPPSPGAVQPCVHRCSVNPEYIMCIKMHSHICHIPLVQWSLLSINAKHKQQTEHERWRSINLCHVRVYLNIFKTVKPG